MNRTRAYIYKKGQVFTLPLVTIAVAVALFLGCGKSKSGIEGTYTSKQNPDNIREINRDGTFYGKEHLLGSPIEFTGKWTVKGNEITFSLPIGLATKAKIQGDSIIDDDGEVWVKKGGLERGSGRSKTGEATLLGKYYRIGPDGKEVIVELEQGGSCWSLLSRGNYNAQYGYNNSVQIDLNHEDDRHIVPNILVGKISGEPPQVSSLRCIQSEASESYFQERAGGAAITIEIRPQMPGDSPIRCRLYSKYTVPDDNPAYFRGQQMVVEFLDEKRFLLLVSHSEWRRKGRRVVVTSRIYPPSQKEREKVIAEMAKRNRPYEVIGDSIVTTWEYEVKSNSLVSGDGSVLVKRDSEWEDPAETDQQPRRQYKEVPQATKAPPPRPPTPALPAPAPDIGGYVQESQKAVGMVQSSIGRAKGIAEIEHLRIIQGAVDQWAMDHPRERCTIQALQQAGHNIPQAPPGCRFDIDSNNQAVVVESQPAAPAPAPAPAAPAPTPAALAPFSSTHNSLSNTQVSTGTSYPEIAFGLNLYMAWIPGGTFQMGSESSQANSSEKPVHTVALDGFWIGKYEVTQRQYEAVMGTNPSEYKGPERPVENVNWEDAMEFCRKLSQLSGTAYTLPTEAQWEYACRAGSNTEFCFGDSEGGLGDYAWYDANSDGQTHDVGKKKPNAWGLHDMHGNVCEWCSDWYGSYPGGSQKNAVAPSSGDDRQSSRRAEPAHIVTPSSGGERVLRGGLWDNDSRHCRSGARDSYFPDLPFNYGHGFRLARTRTLEGSALPTKAPPGPKATPRPPLLPQLSGMGEISLKGMDGEMTIGQAGNVAIPDGFPKDVLVYKGAVAKIAMKQLNGFCITLETADDMKKVADAYQSNLKTNGWEEEAVMSMNEAITLSYEKANDKPKRNLVVCINKGGNEGKTVITVTVMAEE